MTAVLRMRGLPDTLADSEHMAIGMAHVHLADIPWHVGRGEGHFDIRLAAFLVDRVDVIHPDRHPHSFVSRRREFSGRWNSALATSALAVEAEEDLTRAGADSAEARWITPVPDLFPSEALEPPEALPDVRDVENRSERVRDHAVIPRGNKIPLRRPSARRHAAYVRLDRAGDVALLVRLVVQLGQVIRGRPSFTTERDVRMKRYVRHRQLSG